MRESIATIVGFIVAAAIPPLFLVFGLPLVYGQPASGNPALTAPQALLIFYFYSFVFVIVLGVPTFLALRPFRPGHWWSVAAVGALLGIGIAKLLRLTGKLDPHDLLWAVPSAVLSAITFWLIWKWGAKIKPTEILKVPHGEEGSASEISKP
jgi:hypothetical protein